MPRIICVGSINMDIAAYAASLPRPGETIMGTALLSSPGGKGLNQAVAACRLGADVAFVGNVGRDANGETLLAFMTHEGIDTALVAKLEGEQTGAAVILVDQESENAIVVIPGANMVWPSVVRLGAVSVGDIVMAQFEVPDPVILAAFTTAKAAGARTILNAAPARPISEALMPLIDILIVNEGELAAVSGRTFDAADMIAVERVALELAGDKMVVVCTLGRRGALVAANGKRSLAHGIAVAAVDTAGAGDCFTGALATALLKGDGLASAAAYANRAAAVSVTRKGTALALPFAADLDQ